MTWGWLQTSKIQCEGFAFRSCQRVHVLQRGNSHIPLQLEFSPFQVSFCLSVLSCQSTGLWWGSLSCTWSAEREVFRDEVQRATRETWGLNYFKSQNEHWDLNQSFQSAALCGHRRILSLRCHLILNPTPHSDLDTSSLHTHLLQVPEEKVVVFI